MFIAGPHLNIRPTHISLPQAPLGGLKLAVKAPSIREPVADSVALSALSTPAQTPTPLTLDSFSNLQPGQTAVVAGGGITGMATALNLAKRGLKVAILEARIDPATAQGQSLQAEAKRWTELSRQARAEGKTEEAKRLLKLSDDTRKKLWGSRNRGIVIDAQSQNFLKGLGVDAQALTAPQRIADPVPGGMDWEINFGERKVKRSDGRMDAQSLVIHRDISVQTRINELERLIREAVKSNPNIVMEFGTSAADAQEESDRVWVELASSQQIVEAGMLVVADGGGRRSLVGKMGVKRLEKGRERLSTAAFQDLGQPAYDRTTALFASDTDTHLECLFAGGDGNINVNVYSPSGEDAPTAVEVAQEWGLEEPLAETPKVYDYIFDRAEQFVVGSRTLIAGDAAARGTAIFGLGSQFGMYYAQMVGDLIDQNGGSCQQLKQESLDAYQQKATTAAELRLGFEGKATVPFSLGLRGSPKLLDILKTNKRGPGLTNLKLGYSSDKADSGKLRLEADIDVSAPPSEEDELARLRRAISPAHLSGALDLKFTPEGLIAKLDPDNPLRIRNKIEEITITEGSCSIGRNDKGAWSLDLKDVLLQRQSEHSEVETSIESFNLTLPPDFGDQLPQTSLEFEGPFQAELSLTKSEGNTHLNLRRESGLVLPNNVSELVIAHDLPGGKTLAFMNQGLRTAGGVIGALIGGVAGLVMGNMDARIEQGTEKGQELATRTSHRAVDAVAKAAASTVKEVDAELSADGTVKVDLHIPGLREIEFSRKQT